MKRSAFLMGVLLFSSSIIRTFNVAGDAIMFVAIGRSRAAFILTLLRHGNGAPYLEMESHRGTVRNQMEGSRDKRG